MCPLCFGLLTVYEDQKKELGVSSSAKEINLALWLVSNLNFDDFGELCVLVIRLWREGLVDQLKP